MRGLPILLALVACKDGVVDDSALDTAPPEPLCAGLSLFCRVVDQLAALELSSR